MGAMLGALMLALVQAPASSCPIADEPAFAMDKDHAVQVGGGAMYASARERRYLDALRGPRGEPLTYKRLGITPLDKDGRTILDAYEVTHPGLEKPLVFYLDAYHFDDALKAPKGFACAVSFALSAPPPDAMLAAENLIQLAIDQGAAKDFAPISLDADGSHAHGVLLDYFRVIARAARAASAAGTPIDPRQPSFGLMRSRMIVIAYPLRCGDKEPVAPAAIEIVAAQGAPPRRDGDLATGESLARLLPGMTLPPSSMAAAFLIDRPRAGDSIRISYPDGGCGAANEAMLPMKYANAKPIDTPQPALPAGHPPTDRPVRLQALIDVDGAAQTISYLGGPETLAGAAVTAVRAWTAEPARLNGSGIVTPVTLQVKFVQP
ncbi:MAG TPA: hypothetical protein VKH34_09105 [Vicinamibacterales bacterium]|nr:hypothetical protein [Vicinamibacterales bacterium]